MLASSYGEFQQASLGFTAEALAASLVLTGIVIHTLDLAASHTIGAEQGRIGLTLHFSPGLTGDNLT
jgi:hypothetical protein